ncbi:MULTISPECIES: arsenite efflux transporter metallochaperone ArsD [Sporolactobacillus]|uniref:Arsenical resistance operon trans-acting repressor ArsD n=3 Tax=Sporolactobacillus TaxID=2077 RepID=A0A4Y1ZAQ4_9BACL|nr:MULTISPECIES: arsenite efflux transporter metallochaperone ArsD [Sporolactobacillus]KLI02752.1 arsenic resistance operon repressor [Sporolactobacillus inulinus CASD]QAA21406.1 arsenical resistance operon transcriptional repressor ArsD [Sporolactobacillus terrae]QAA24378.1 arsenical resistance operon transcriptional repressor ArsD [Sporolactobacillus terrae]UAK16203.1 arsenite efflux transporter metallochaperone ArsD [Sporolactobacillus terrae]GAY76119.1 arsenical resistance operon trans-act
MKSIQIFEAAMCCATGVCGPSTDSELIRITCAVRNIRRKEFDIVRMNLTSNPDAFVANSLIRDLLKKEGTEVLPITLADGKLVKKGSYPTNQELAEWSGIALEAINKKQHFQFKLNMNQ